VPSWGFHWLWFGPVRPVARRILIAGSRDWPTDLFEKRARQMLADLMGTLDDDDIIVHGGARGIDRWAGEEAIRRGLGVEVYPADWKRYGSRAGFIRNKQMIDTNPDEVWIFWNGFSAGSAHTRREAIAKGLTVKTWTPIVWNTSEFPTPT